NVGSDAFVLDSPAIITREETATWCNGRSAIDKRRRVRGMNQASPRAFAHQQSKLSVMEHVGHQVAARSGHLVDDHDLRPPDAGRRTGEWITIAGDVVEVAVEVCLQYIDDVIRCGTTAVETLVDD